MNIPPKHKFINPLLCFIFGVVMVFIGFCHGMAAPPLIFTDHSGTIALDPGHGGQYAGVRGPTGHLEKTVCLDLARKLALQLEPEYRVVLTRSDDYHVELLQRTAVANHAKADLFISLHTGSSFLHATQGVTIFYHKPAAPQSARPADQEGKTNVQQTWDQIQSRHSTASQALAAALKTQIEGMPQAPQCRIQAAPLTVLQGADMPAVIIEIGHLTHPATEKALSSPRGVDLMATAIKKGVVQFLNN